MHDQAGWRHAGRMRIRLTEGQYKLPDNLLLVLQLSCGIANRAGLAYGDKSTLALGALHEPDEGRTAAVIALFSAVIPESIHADGAFGHGSHLLVISLILSY